MANSITIASSTTYRVGEILRYGTRRLRVTKRLTRAEFDEVRAWNAAVREAHGRKTEDYVRVTASEKREEFGQGLGLTVAEPPVECNHYYLVEEVKRGA